MIYIKEKEAKKLPNLTSLFIKPPFNLNIIKNIEQQEIYNLDKDGTFELPISKLFFLINLLKSYDDISFTPFKQKETIFKKIDPTGFKIQPYDYQLDGIEYGLNKNGWLLLDDQGLGKTLQMIYLAQTLKETEGLEHCLIICGVNGLKWNWAREIEKFSDLSYTILGQKTNRKGKIVIGSVAERRAALMGEIKEFFVITNIETLQSNDFSKNFTRDFKKSKSKFDMIVLDEAHKAKNPNSKAVKTLMKMKSKRNIALTGTIIMNNPENAYVPLKWTGNLNSTYGMFKRMYNVYGGYGGVQVVAHKNLHLLHEHLKQCSLRRLKTDVLKSLPDKVYQLDYVEMGAKQRKLYEAVEQKIAEEIDLLPKRKITLMEEMTMNMRLRQVTAWPGMLSTDEIPSAKLDRLDELVENITAQGDKIVIFTTFKGGIPEIEKRLSKYGVLVCTGDVSDDDINKNKEIFENDPTKKILLATWQKMGTGHTLTAANYMIFIDTPWTDADFQQSSDRIYRIGQKKNVFIITLITKDTYDERVQQILDRKQILSGFLVDGNNSDDIVQVDDYY